MGVHCFLFDIFKECLKSFYNKIRKNTYEGKINKSILHTILREMFLKMGKWVIPSIKYKL